MSVVWPGSWRAGKGCETGADRGDLSTRLVVGSREPHWASRPVGPPLDRRASPGAAGPWTLGQPTLPMDDVISESSPASGASPEVLVPLPRKTWPTPPSESPASGPARVLAARRARLLALAVVAGLSALLLTYWYRYAPVVPIWDGWFWIGQGRAFAEGGFGRLLHETHPLVYSDHLYLLPSSIALLVGPLFDYSFRPFALACVLALIGSGLVFFRLARGAGVGFLGATLAFLSVTSLRHWENMLLGFQLGLPLCVLLGCLALVVAERRKDVLGLASAGGLCVAAALCSSGGFTLVAVLFLVRWFDLRRPRWWIAVGIAGALVLPLLHFLLLYLYDVSFIASALGKVSWHQLPATFQHAVKLLGGGVVGGRVAAPVGFFLWAGACALVVTRVRKTRRIDAVSGLAIWGLLNALAIAAGRQPFVEPASRHEIFVAPAIGACAIGLAQILSRFASARAPAYTALFVGFTWCFSDNWIDAQNYKQIVSDGDLEARFALVSMAHGDVLSAEELGRVNPYPTEHVRGLLQYVIERRWLIFSGADTAFQEHHDLPSRDFGGVQATRAADRVEFSGPGYVFEEYECPFGSGCAVQLVVDASATGAATAGILVLGPNGVETSNFVAALPNDGAFARSTTRGLVQAGSKLRAYVYANSPADSARVRAFSVRLLNAAP